MLSQNEIHYKWGGREFESNCRFSLKWFSTQSVYIHLSMKLPQVFENFTMLMAIKSRYEGYKITGFNWDNIF